MPRGMPPSSPNLPRNPRFADMTSSLLTACGEKARDPSPQKPGKTHPNKTTGAFGTPIPLPPDPATTEKWNDTDDKKGDTLSGTLSPSRRNIRTLGTRAWSENFRKTLWAGFIP